MTHSVSIITPVYNRKDKVITSVLSSLELVNEGFAKEVIVVDDASTDGSLDAVIEYFAAEIAKEVVKTFKLPKNLGVTGAKNFGASKASGDYLAFMDSDDIFVKGSGVLMNNDIQSRADVSLFFFRCKDISDDKLIGPYCEAHYVTFSELLNSGTPGECLPVVSTSAFSRYPYDAELRGCESLTYLKIASENRQIFLSDKIVRGYCSEGDDRLSTRTNINKRAKQLFTYNVRLLAYCRTMSYVVLFKTMLKIAKYGLTSIINRFS